MRYFARALRRGHTSPPSMYIGKPISFTKDGGGLLQQLPQLRVRAATGASKITFLGKCASGLDLTSRILHQADQKVWALRSSLCLTVFWLVARVTWAYFGWTCLCQTYFLDASEWSLALVLWVFIFISKTPHQSQQFGGIHCGLVSLFWTVSVFFTESRSLLDRHV